MNPHRCGNPRAVRFPNVHFVLVLESLDGKRNAAAPRTQVAASTGKRADRRIDLRESMVHPEGETGLTAFTVL